MSIPSFPLPPDAKARMDMLSRQHAQATVDPPRTPDEQCGDSLRDVDHARNQAQATDNGHHRN